MPCPRTPGRWTGFKRRSSIYTPAWSLPRGCRLTERQDPIRQCASAGFAFRPGHLLPCPLMQVSPPHSRGYGPESGVGAWTVERLPHGDAMGRHVGRNFPGALHEGPMSVGLATPSRSQVGLDLSPSGTPAVFPRAGCCAHLPRRYPLGSPPAGVWRPSPRELALTRYHQYQAAARRGAPEPLGQ